MREANLEHGGEFILGTNQNPYSIISPDHVKGVDEFGNLVKKKLKNDEEIISVYWAKKHKQIALLMIVSAGTLFAVLLQETNLLQYLFIAPIELLLSFIGGFI